MLAAVMWDWLAAFSSLKAACGPGAEQDATTSGCSGQDTTGPPQMTVANRTVASWLKAIACRSLLVSKLLAAGQLQLLTASLIASSRQGLRDGHRQDLTPVLPELTW